MNPTTETVRPASLEERFWEHRVVAKLGMGVGHDMNNHLVTVVGLVDYLRGRLEDDSPEATILDDIARSAQSASRLARDYMRLAMNESPQPVHQDLFTILRDGIPLLKATMPAGVKFETDIDDSASLEIIVGSYQLLRLLAGICRLAGTTAGRGNRIRLECKAGSDSVVIHVFSPDAEIEIIPDTLPDSVDSMRYDLYHIHRIASHMGFTFSVHPGKQEETARLELCVNTQLDNPSG